MRRPLLTHTLRPLKLKGALLCGAMLMLSTSSIHAQTAPSGDPADAPPVAVEAPNTQKPAETSDTSPINVAATPDAAPLKDHEAQPPERCLITKTDREQVTSRLKKMRAKPAAKMLAVMNPELAADLLLRLDARQSARILNELPPRTGATLLTLLSSP